MKNTFDLKRLIRPNVLAMAPYSSARDEYKTEGKSMVFFDANENPFETGVNRYPDPQHEALKELLADQKGMSKENILLGNGSDEVLDLIFRTFCRPGIDNIITLPPTYGMYKVLAALNDVQDREVNLSENFQPDSAKILQQVDEHTRIIFLCSPNNPTGNSFSDAAVEKLLQNFQGLVVIDEAYIDFAEGPGWLNRLSSYPNLLITQTLSKAYGLAGIRLGICYASAEIIDVLKRIKPPYNINTLSQQKALQRISDHRNVQREIRIILEQRDLLRTALGSFTFVREIFPSDANFLLVRVDNASRRYTQLLEKGVVVRNRSSQVGCENTLRFTIGTPDENQQLLDTLKQMEI